ncbi:MAG: coenzyme F420-0:L-glutamate ligase, partial [Erysipelotrichaceae bacterium]|nr:coenzyme F420-0:L-glutamate ligase [Erysipelotrichaceae bacterium]
MERKVGTISMGIRCPIFRQGDDLSRIVPECVMTAVDSLGMKLEDRDIIAITESVVGRVQGNYCSVDDIAEDIRNKYGDDAIGLIFPITSRNRFSLLLKGIARGAKKIVLMLSYPSDEVGNQLISIDKVDEAGIDPYRDVLDLKRYRELFGDNKHEFTGIDYVAYYKSIIEEENCGCEIIFGNDPKAILKYTDSVLNCDIHTRKRTRRILLDAGARKVYGLDEIMTRSINGSGYNSRYGLLGSNKASEDTVKLFPEEGEKLVYDIQKTILEKTGAKVEVMVYGDGAFKDPQGKIWELADPVVSPFYTDGLKGTPNELKLKYLADNDYKDLSGEELKEAISRSIRNKDADLNGTMATEGTTPRQLTDLIGS